MRDALAASAFEALCADKAEAGREPSRSASVKCFAKRLHRERGPITAPRSAGKRAPADSARNGRALAADLFEKLDFVATMWPAQFGACFSCPGGERAARSFSKTPTCGPLRALALSYFSCAASRLMSA